MGASFSDRKTINIPVAQLQALFLDPAFAVAQGLTVKSNTQTPYGMQFVYNHGVTMTSWGENITVTLSATGPYTTNIDILSKCQLPTQIVDWGTNQKNVESVFNYVLQNVGRYQMAGQMPQQQPMQPMQQPMQPMQQPMQPMQQPMQPMQQPMQPMQQQPQGYGFCRHCGAPLPADGIFCSICGGRNR